jgi:hypothetical protein
MECQVGVTVMDVFGIGRRGREEGVKCWCTGGLHFLSAIRRDSPRFTAIRRAGRNGRWKMESLESFDGLPGENNFFPSLKRLEKPGFLPKRLEMAKNQARLASGTQDCGFDGAVLILAPSSVWPRFNLIASGDTLKGGHRTSGDGRNENCGRHIASARDSGLLMRVLVRLKFMRLFLSLRPRGLGGVADPVLDRTEGRCARRSRRAAVCALYPYIRVVRNVNFPFGGQIL